MILTLDEAEVIDEDKDYEAVLLSLINTDETQSSLYKKRVSIIVINNSEYSSDKMNRGSDFQFKQNIVSFHQYSSDQMIDILQQRASETLQEDTWILDDLANIIQLVDTRCNGYFDPRMGLEILWRSARIAEQHNLTKINLDYLDISQELPFENSKIEFNLKIQEKVILFVVAQILLQNPNQTFTRIKEIKKEFDRVKSNLDIPFKSLGYTSIFNYLNNLKKFETVNILISVIYLAINGKS